VRRPELLRFGDGISITACSRVNERLHARRSYPLGKARKLAFETFTDLRDAGLCDGPKALTKGALAAPLRAIFPGAADGGEGSAAERAGLAHAIHQSRAPGRMLPVAALVVALIPTAVDACPQPTLPRAEALMFPQRLEWTAADPKHRR
jgi:hypothetical protein